MPTDKMARYAAIKAEHAQRLHRHGISLHCYECEQMVKYEDYHIKAREGRPWTRIYRVDPDATVVFYPNQDESFSVMVRRAGNETTNRLRKVLEHPGRCRLLCPAHVERAKNGWTKRREEIRREWAGCTYDTPAYDWVSPSGKTYHIDDTGIGPFGGDIEFRAKCRRLRAEWLAEDGDPPPYDGEGWVKL